MKKLVGGIIGLLLVVAVAGFAPSNASAHSFFGFGTVVPAPDTVYLVGCVDDETVDALIASDAFITPAPFVLCVEGHTSVYRILPQGPGS